MRMLSTLLTAMCFIALLFIAARASVPSPRHAASRHLEVRPPMVENQPLPPIEDGAALERPPARTASEPTPLLWKDMAESKKRDYLRRNYGDGSTSATATLRPPPPFVAPPPSIAPDRPPAPVAKEETPLLWKDWPEVKKRDFITRNYGAEATSDPASPRQQKKPQPQPQPRQVAEPPAVAASATSATMAIEYYAHGGLYYEANWTSPSDTCGTEAHADYDGTASCSWGYGPKGLKARTAGECCDHCRKNAKCNTWVWCGEPFCFAPDVWNHTFGECWLKANPDPTMPKVNMRGRYTPFYRSRHKNKDVAYNAPLFVQWTSGVIRLKEGTRPRNGTWSGRSVW